MKNNNINEIITNALVSKRHNNISKEQELIKSLKDIINNNQILIEKSNEIDIINENGFKIDINIINKIIDKYIGIEPLIHEKEEIKRMNNNMLYSKVYTNIGTILTLFDGNTYIMLEMIILGLLTHNTIIFNYNSYMYGTNGLLITLIQSILEQNNYNKYMFQHTIDIDNVEYFKNFRSIDKTIIIGDNDFINNNLKRCTTPTIISGYKNYDIYIDENIDDNLINKIIDTKENINIYIKENINIDIENAMYVNNVDEAITQINYNSSKYSSSIFTKNNENASKFIKEINSKYVMVNTSPTKERSLDIEEKDLLKEKNIYMPNIYK